MRHIIHYRILSVLISFNNHIWYIIAHYNKILTKRSAIPNNASSRYSKNIIKYIKNKNSMSLKEMSVVNF